MKPRGAKRVPRLCGEKEDGGEFVARPPEEGLFCQLGELSDGELVRQARAGHPEFLNPLLRRHWKYFLSLVRRRCGWCAWAEDICQEGCLKALARLGQLKQPETFPYWVKEFITHEWQHCRRGCKKNSATLDADCTSQVERLGAAPQELAASDRKHLWSVLWQDATLSRGRMRQVAVFMLQFYRVHEELPAVRVLAELTHCSHGTAERSRAAVLRVWRRRLAGLGFYP
jgi:DNA-directed RNA polymerase specialized sigma24 family protein